MASQYTVYNLTIPADNGYAENPESVDARVTPHLQQIEPCAEMAHEDGPHWTLTTPTFGAELVTHVLVSHYGFLVRETGVNCR